MVDEFSAAAIDCAGTAAHRHGETRHPQRGHFDMELLVREGLDVQPQQGLAVDLARRARTLARCIVQELLPTGEDIRVNIFGDEVYAAEKTVESIDGRLDAQLWREHTLPERLARKLVRLLRALGLDYGCADLRRLPDGRYFFLEVNPAGQFLMVERDTKQPLVESLCRLLTRTGHEATATHRRLPLAG